MAGVASAPRVGAQKTSDPGKGALTRPANTDPAAIDASHSQYGSAFNQGPRQEAKLLSGIGNVHFVVTTGKPLAQRFFDQGVNLLYSFSWFEAERSFRQAAKIDPECAMAYWGMAMCDYERGKEFIKLAVAKKGHVTDRERRYIDALAITFKADVDESKRTAENLKALDQLILAYPDDIEAKAIYAWALKNQKLSDGVSNRLAIDALLKQVLAKNPLHPGANHFRIHLWDGSPEAAQALDSCRAYPKAAPSIGHAQHMPGHIYAQLGMWDESAFAMDAAARSERRYFYEFRRMPWDSWNYSHDSDYLIANLGYTGRIREGIALSYELLNEPHDPDYNEGTDYGIAGNGRFSLMRMWVRGELWDEVLRDANRLDGESTEARAWKSYALALAYLGKGDLDNAKKQIRAREDLKVGGDAGNCAGLELRGRELIAEGKADAGIAELRKAVDIEKEKFRFNDPSPYPHPIYETLAVALMQQRRFHEATEALNAGLDREHSNGFGQALLVESLKGEGKAQESQSAFEKLQSTWRYADADLVAVRRVAAIHTGVALASLSSDRVPGFTRPYPKQAALERQGPARWRPFPAADVTLHDSSGKAVHLSEYQGKNVLLVFFLGGRCQRCLEQLERFGQEKASFAKLDTELVAVSPDSASDLKRLEAMAERYPFRQLSDTGGAAARKFNAYDEFEDLPLHGTYLINRRGEVWWFRSGSDPFTNVAFLKKEIPRMEAWTQ
jgi:peroxiredoxin